jgi:hypothetical protein
MFRKNYRFTRTARCYKTAVDLTTAAAMKTSIPPPPLHRIGGNIVKCFIRRTQCRSIINVVLDEH